MVNISYRGDLIPWFSKFMDGTSLKDIQHQLPDIMKLHIKHIEYQISILKSFESILKKFN